MRILFINACVRKESRTLVLAKKVMENMSGEVTELKLDCEGLLPLTGELLEKRESLIGCGKLDDPMFDYARQFAEADEIVIAAPYWDLSFPALLKIYLERVAVAGITFEYRFGRPYGLCRAKKLTYVTTAGGEIFADFGYSYVKTLANCFYGIEETECHRAVNLDAKMITPERLFSDAEISVIK